MDTVSKEKRSKIMSAIHSRDTLPEVVVRKMLWENGYRFRVCDKRIVGHPDIVIPKCRALIEVRGCFWHQHGWRSHRGSWLLLAPAWVGVGWPQACPNRHLRDRHEAEVKPRVLEREVPAKCPPRRGTRKGVDGRWMEPHRHLGMWSQDDEGA